MGKKRRKNDLLSGGQITNESTDCLKSFEEAEEFFLTEQKLSNKAKHTLRWHKENLHTLHKFLKDQQLDPNPQNITLKLLQKNYILYMLEEKGLSPVTINGRIRTIKAFFKLLKREKLIAEDPAVSLELLKTEKTLIQTFSKDQIEDMLKQPNKKTFTGLRDYLIMSLLLETGVRLSELVNITIEDIRMHEGLIKLMGKGRKERMVPFQNTFKKTLKQYLQFRGELDHDFLFCNIENNPLRRRNVQDRLKIYGRMANINNIRVSPHTFRHTMAKMYIMNGGDIFSLQKILGHSSLDMVRRYVELFSSDVVNQHKKFSPLENLSKRA